MKTISCNCSFGTSAFSSRSPWLVGALCLTLGISMAHAVEVAPVFSSHMVLQRDMTVPIWGTAKPGEKITVTFRDQQKATEADKDGKWMVKLDKLDVGKPATLTIAGANTLTLEDVVVGEVWIGSGQSNMDMRIVTFAKDDPVLAKYAAETYPSIRMYSQTNENKMGWGVASPKRVYFSALLFSFAVPLQKELDVPVGIIRAACGGSPSGPWLTEGMFNTDPACKELVAKLAADEAVQKRYAAAIAKYQEDLAKWETAVAEIRAKGPATQPAREPAKPQAPAKVGECREGMGGLYRSTIQPIIPYAIRGVFWDQGESGTAVEGVDQFTLMGALIKGWRKEWNQGDFPFIYSQKPSGCGCAWDYKDPITCMADPFEPLPARPPYEQNGASESYIQMLRYPNTAMVITSDLGSGNHPKNKAGYGARAARVAMGAVYGKKIEYYGPMYASHKIDGDRVHISYTHVGVGLAFANGEKLQGFFLAGEDKVFYWADAAIEGNEVVLTCPKVPHPVAARYGWAWRYRWANLFNKDGLPAIPFRTDSW